MVHDDLDMVAAVVFAGYGPLRERPAWLPYPEADFDHPWRDAADKLGAATDLLDTHLGPHRESRSEQADMVLDPHQRRGALAFIAQLTSLVMSADSAMAAARIDGRVAESGAHQNVGSPLGTTGSVSTRSALSLA